MLPDGVVIDMPTQTGNPNVFTIFNGRHKVTLADNASASNENVMLTCINTIQFMGSFTANADGEIGTLPEACRPLAAIHVPCYSETANSMQSIAVSAEGVMTGEPSYVYNLGGCMFNISGNYY